MDCDDWWIGDRVSCEVDDVQFLQPVGFVWFTRPRYRVKAKGVRRQMAEFAPTIQRNHVDQLEQNG